MTSCLPPRLSASVPNSFAYKTIKDRVPTIVAKVVDTAHRRRHDLIASRGPGAADDIKAVVAQLSQLRYEMMTDKPIKPLHTAKADAADWAAAFEAETKLSETGTVSWFKSSWLFVECYLYRKLDEIIESSSVLHEWDPFEMQKEQAFVGSLPAIVLLGQHVHRLCQQQHKREPNDIRETLADLLQISLWGNKYDLSISAGDQIKDADDHSPLHVVNKFKPKIVSDQLDAALTALLRPNHDGAKAVHFVLDNCGMELFFDLCLAEYLLSIGLTKQIVFHAKMIPWFVSDVTPKDFNWTLEILRGSTDPALNELAHRWHTRVDEGTFVVRTDHFWTSAHPMSDMPASAPGLYAQLRQAHYLVLKGDMNYRKLVGDLDWPPTTPYSVALRHFHPCPSVALRTLKADVCVGLGEGVKQRLDAECETWQVTGDYAVIQFDDPGEVAGKV